MLAKNLVRLLLLATLVIVFLFPSFFASAYKPEVIEISAEQDLKDLKDLVQRMEKILRERNACKPTAKDYKQECICAKSKDYIEFAEKNMNLLSNPSRGVWIDAILSYDDNGEIKRMNIKRFSQLDLSFSTSCLRQKDGTYIANHEWDKPELLLKSPDDIKELNYLYEAEKKIGMAISKCYMPDPRTYQQCQCIHVEKTELLYKRLELLDKKHPDWKKHILVYSHDGYVIKKGWEEDLKKAKKKSENACKN